MDTRPVVIGLIIALVIISAGALWAVNWFSDTYEPAKETLQAIQATQNLFASKTAQEATQFYNATQTIETGNLFSTQTAQAGFRMQTETAAAQTATYEAEMTRATATQSAAMTMTAMPTMTPMIITECSARVVRDNTVINRVPSDSRHLSDSIIVNDGTRVVVNSLVRGSSWVHVVYDDQSGFINSANVVYTDQNCTPETYDLHFMAGWLPPDWKVVVEDTFTTNEHLWFLKESGEQLLPQIQRQRASLRVVSDGDVQTFSTSALQQHNFSAIRLHVNFGAYPTITGGYIAYRFYNNADSYTEFRFFPRDCSYAVFENDQLSFDANVISSVCIGMYYDLVLTIQPNGSVMLLANGEEYGPMRFSGIANPNSISEIYFSVFNITAQVDFIFVSVPR